MEPIISGRIIFFLAGSFFVFAYWIYVFIILYHLTRFGIGTLPKRLAGVFLLGSISIFLVMTVFFTRVDSDSIAGIFSLFKFAPSFEVGPAPII